MLTQDKKLFERVAEELRVLAGINTSSAIGKSELTKLRRRLPRLIEHVDDAAHRELEDADPDELIWLMCTGEEAKEAVYLKATEVARQIALKYCRRYYWIDPDDLSQELILSLPKFIDAYRVGHRSGTPWGKYLYHKLNFKAKDILRLEDPLGIGWPQKQHYPSWSRLGDEALEGFDAPDARPEPVLEEPDEFQADLEALRGLLGEKPSPLKKRRTRKPKGTQNLLAWREERKNRQLNLF